MLRVETASASGLWEWVHHYGANQKKKLLRIGTGGLTMKLETAERLLRKNYERALSLKWVHLPIAWALYQTWKQVEPKEDESVSVKRAKLRKDD